MYYVIHYLLIGVVSFFVTSGLYPGCFNLSSLLLSRYGFDIMNTLALAIRNPAQIPDKMTTRRILNLSAGSKSW